MNARQQRRIKSSIELAVLFILLLAISDLIKTLYPFDTGTQYSLTACLLPIVSGLLCFGVLVSESTKVALKKWTLSVPFTLVFWLVLAITDFPVRLTNMLYPGYGTISAGGGFAQMVDLWVLSISQGFANLLAVGISSAVGNKFPKVRFVVQDIVLPVICIAIILVVLYLELTMPPVEAIYQSVY